MINNILRGTFYFVVFALIQIFVLNNIHFLRIATPFLYLYFILKLPVGTIAAHKKQRDDNFYTLEVLLATDFTSLQHVRIINNKRQKEQIEVEQEAKRND